MKNFIVLLILYAAVGCKVKNQNLYIPEISEGMSEGIYNRYKSKLDTAYLKQDDFEIGIQLANLKAPGEIVYKRINSGIKVNQENCYRIYDWYDGYENDFLNNIVKTDTVKFLQSFDLCESLKGKESYSEYRTRKTLEYEKRIAERELLDSSKLNYDLIALLQEIKVNDQETRVEISIQRIDDDNHPLWLKQKRLDSINLIKIDSILQNGFPTKEEIGYDGASAIWLVLHHQGNLETRMKYMSVLDKAAKDGNLSDGALATYKWRNEYIKLSKE